MYTNSEIEKLISELDINQLKNILSNYYSKSGNYTESIYNRLNNRSVTFDWLKYELSELIISDNIDAIEVIIELNS